MKLIPAMLTVLLPLGLSAQEKEENKVSTKVEKVTLYLQGAYEYRSGKVNLTKGDNEIIFTDLPLNMNNNTIQVGSSSELTIVSVNYRRDYITELELTPEAKLLKDSVDAYAEKRDLKYGLKSVYTATKNMILLNKVVKGETAGMEIEDVTELADFYREKLRELDNKIIDADIAVRNLNEKINNFQNQLNEVSAGLKKSTSQVVVKLQSNTALKTDVYLSYLTYDAGWEPYYDLRAAEVGGPVELSYKANVWQSTGYDWKNVKLSLSTGNPNLSNDLPYVSPWVLNYAAYPTGQSGYLKLEDKKNKAYDFQHNLDPEYTYTWDFGDGGVAANDQGMNVSFDIPTPYSIPSDNKRYNVEVTKHSLAASYQYLAIPKLDNDAFLLAKITKWDELNLISANANIYFKGTYVGKIYLNTSTTKDTLEISMGRDKGIQIERLPINDKTARDLSSSTRKISEGYEIKISNNKNIAVDLILFDHVPLSRNKDVTVDVQDVGGAQHNKETGKLTWKLKLNPQEKKSVKFNYVVKYPKTYIISNL